MKVDGYVRKELIEGLTKNLEELVAYVKETMHTISIAESVEEIMRLKQKLLIEWMEKLPSSDRLCYFCIPATAYCQDCLYGKFHEVCNAEGSIWKKIQKAKADLMVLLEDYYKGEHYDNRRKTIYCPACNKKFRRKLSEDGNYGYCSACMMFLGKGEKFGN